jgi:predicted Zn finger-like uncharacterized protein
MSLVTRCTSCGTLFKVVADQLKISEGWVRCGQCATVFDAQANLVEAPQIAAPAPPPVPAFTPAPSPAAEATTDASDSRAFGQDSIRESSFNAQDREALLAAFGSPSRFGAPRQDSATVPAGMLPPAAATQPASFSGFSSGFSVPPPPPETAASSPQPAQLAGLKTGGDSVSPESRLDSKSFRPGNLRDSGELDSEVGPSTTSWASSEYSDDARAQAAAVSFSAEPTTVHSPSSIDASSLPEPELSAPNTTPQPTPSFVKQAQRAQRWRSPWMRLALCLVGLVLLAALAVQVGLHDKDRIAAQWPQTKPWLDQLCQHAGCQVQALKRIEVITVDASSFNRINKNNAQLEATTQSYRLAVTLKNTGNLPVALPHVELSLQDAQDQPLLSRVLSPADLGSGLQALAPAQDMAGSLTLQIDTAQLAGNRISGYRVLAFYP